MEGTWGDTMNYLAIDIGGSAIKSAIVDADGNILEKNSHPTPLTNFDDFMAVLYQVVEWGESRSLLNGIAVSQPCATDTDTAEALSEGALIYIKNTNPARLLGEKYGYPYAAENDGNCAALGELWVGGAKDARNVALVVCGSGIGGAVIIDRKIIPGHRRFAGEFGFFITGFEPDGTPVNWSANGSTLALVKDYAKRSGKDAETLNGKLVFELADNGDEVASACVTQFFRNFAYGLHNLQHVYDPELILIGGAVSNRHDFIEKIEAQFDILYQQLFGFMSRPLIQRCEKGADANLIGAVYHLLQK